MKINEITASSIVQTAKNIKQKVKKATARSDSNTVSATDKGEPVLQQLAKSLKGLKGEFNKGASIGAKLLSR